MSDLPHWKKFDTRGFDACARDAFDSGRNRSTEEKSLA